MAPILGILASSNYQRVTPDNGAMFPIQMINVGSGGASVVEFTSIPQTYKHLQIRAFAPSGAYGIIRFNNDTTTSNYRNHYLLSTGSSGLTAGTNASNAYWPNPGSISNVWSGVLDILDYSSTSKYKTYRSLEGFDNNGYGEIYYTSGLYMSTSAISTSIKITSQGANFGQYSQFALYGIKG